MVALASFPSLLSLPRTFLLPASLHWNLTPSFFQESLLICEWLTQHSRGIESALASWKQDWPGIGWSRSKGEENSGCLLHHKVCSPYKPLQKAQVEALGTSGLLSLSQHCGQTLFCSPFPYVGETQNVLSSEEVLLWWTERKPLPLNAFKQSGFPNIVSMVGSSVMFYFQTLHAFENCS